MSVFLSEDWMQSFKSELNKDTHWSEASKYFSARVSFRSEKATGTIDIRDGAVVSAIAASHPLGADMKIIDVERQMVAPNIAVHGHLSLLASGLILKQLNVGAMATAQKLQFPHDRTRRDIEH